MKNKLLVVGTLAFGWLLMMSNSTDVVTKRGDRTGSPVSSASGCNNTGCHGAGTDVTQVTLLNASNASVAQYTPGETYTIKTEITTSASGYGFQTVALLNDDSNAGTSTAKSANVQIESLNSRSYSSQNGGTSATGVFETTWIAPTSGNGDVTFYATGNAVNGNGTTKGDLATIPTSLKVTEITGTGTVPSDPTSLSATAISVSQIDIAWTDNATDEDGYNIERSSDGTNFTFLSSVASNVATYSDNGLTASTTYHYRVTAYNGSGSSASSNIGNATTLADTGGGVGVDETIEESISIYPNPVEEVLNIGNVNIQNIEVLDLSGKKVLFSTNNKVDATSLESGVYILKVVTGNGKQLISKFVKK